MGGRRLEQEGPDKVEEGGEGGGGVEAVREERLWKEGRGVMDGASAVAF